MTTVLLNCLSDLRLKLFSYEKYVFMYKIFCYEHFYLHVNFSRAGIKFYNFNGLQLSTIGETFW